MRLWCTPPREVQQYRVLVRFIKENREIEGIRTDSWHRALQVYNGLANKPGVSVRIMADDQEVLPKGK